MIIAKQMDKIRLQLNTLLNTTRISFYTLFLKPIPNFIYTINCIKYIKTQMCLNLYGYATRYCYNMYLLKTALKRSN